MTSEELLKSGGLFKVRIDLAEAFDAEDEGQAEAVEMLTQGNGDSHYIVLREVNSAEMLEVQEKSQREITEYLEKKIPECIVDHSFQTSSGGKTGNGDVLNILRLSSSLMIHVLTKWQESLPLAKRMHKASEEQAPSSSEDVR
jgi:hypothetical protein